MILLGLNLGLVLNRIAGNNEDETNGGTSKEGNMEHP